MTELLLCAVVVFQQAFWMYQTQKLVDKLMSRNYAEYMQSSLPQDNRPKVEDHGIPEDLSPLNHFLP